MKLSKINQGAKILGLTAALAIPVQQARADAWCYVEAGINGAACESLVLTLGAVVIVGVCTPAAAANPLLGGFCVAMDTAGTLAASSFCYDYMIWSYHQCEGC